MLTLVLHKMNEEYFHKNCCPWKYNFGTDNSIIFEVIPLCSIWQWSCKYFSMGFFQVESFFSIFLCALHCAKPLVLEFIRTPGFIYLDKHGRALKSGCSGDPWNAQLFENRWKYQNSNLILILKSFFKYTSQFPIFCM